MDYPPCPGRKVSSLLGHSRCVILCGWHKKIRPGPTLHVGGGRLGFLNRTGLYQSVIAGVPPTTSAYNAAAQSTYPDNIGLWVRGQALRNTRRTLCAGSGCPSKWVRPSAFGSMDAKHKINTQYIQHKESMKVYVQNKKEACLKKIFSSLINIKLSEKALMSLTGPQRSRHLLTTFLHRVGSG